MAILLINRFPKDKVDFTEWFADLNEEVYLFSSPEGSATFPEFPIRYSFETLSTDARVEVEAVKLFQEHPYHTLIALEESEIIRAGLLRTRLGISGQNYESALAFRDKVIMKTIASKGGIPVAPYSPIHNGLEMHDFIEQNGLPVIIKPTRGMSSMNMHIFRTMQEVEQWLKTANWQGVMVEKFIQGDVYHIDGIVLNGKLVFVCSFAYVDTCIAFLDSKGVGDQLLSIENPLHRRFVEFTERLLNVMPTPRTTTFHLEVFLTQEDDILLCEIASRTSGAAVQDQIQRVFGFSMDRYIARAQCGLIDPVPEVKLGHRLTASYFLSPKVGRLVHMPDSVPFEYCLEYRKKGTLGRFYNGPQRSIDHYAFVLIEASNEQELSNRLQTVIRFIESETVWEYVEDEE